jgi:DNA-binding MarR family transcriptional regulator
VSRDLHDIDAALLRLRRVWTVPPRAVEHRGQQVELSSVLVVEGCGQHAEQGREPTVGGVAEFADVAPSTASRLVDRAVAGGFVQRAPSAQDARRTVLRLTGAGQALRSDASAFRLDWLGRTLSDWPDEDAAQLAALLTRFADAVAAGGGPGRSAPPVA